MRFQNLMLLVICVLPGAMPAMASDDEALQLGQQYTQQFYDKEIVLVWASMTEQMHAALGRESALRQFREKVDGDMGGEAQIVDERIDIVQGFRVYTRTSRFENYLSNGVLVERGEPKRGESVQNVQ